MQEIERVLRDLKRIAPEREYAARSRASILAHRRHARRAVTLAMVFRTAGVAAMASLAFVGGLSLVRVTFPADREDGPVSQQALAAEARTVDTQLALASVQDQIVSGASGMSISRDAAIIAKGAAGTTPDESVDQALDALSR